MVAARDKAIAEIHADLGQLKRFFARLQNITGRQDSIKRYEFLAFEKCREMILDGQGADEVKNPYGVIINDKKAL